MEKLKPEINCSRINENWNIYTKIRVAGQASYSLLYVNVQYHNKMPWIYGLNFLFMGKSDFMH